MAALCSSSSWNHAVRQSWWVTGHRWGLHSGVLPKDMPSGCLVRQRTQGRGEQRERRWLPAASQPLAAGSVGGRQGSSMWLPSSGVGPVVWTDVPRDRKPTGQPLFFQPNIDSLMAAGDGGFVCLFVSLDIIHLSSHNLPLGNIPSSGFNVFRRSFEYHR